MADRPQLIPTGDIRHIVALGLDLQQHATEHNIHNVFDDGGYKELLLLRLFNLKKLHREGDDAADKDGRRYEIKTVARVSSSGTRKTSLSVTTEHTLTQANITRYRAVYLWIVAVFDQSEPEAIYEVTPAALEPYFATWERRLATMQAAATGATAPVHLNNPKIPLSHVIEHGVQVWPPKDTPLPPQVREGLELADRLDDPAPDAD